MWVEGEGVGGGGGGVAVLDGSWHLETKSRRIEKQTITNSGTGIKLWQLDLHYL